MSINQDSHDFASSSDDPERTPECEPQRVPSNDQPDAYSVGWDPPGFAFDDLPPELRQVVDDVIRPTYEKLVRSAPPGLDQSTGLSIVNLIWIEAVDHWRLGNSGMLDRDQNDMMKLIGRDSPDRIFGRLVQAVGLKLRASNVLRQFRQSRVQIARDRQELMEKLRPRPITTQPPCSPDDHQA